MNDLSRRHFLGLTTAAGLSFYARSETGSPVAPLSPSQSVAEALRLGNACHAFDHLGAYGFQAEAAAACGATVLYASGIGGDGYGGLPPEAEWKQRLDNVRAYTKKCHDLGIPVVLGYLCATSIVGLDNFDKNWAPEFRAKFKTPPKEWLQQDIEGKPLESWYGGEYRPACMNHPDWRAYQKEMIRFSIETGHGGIFFDNPTVHPKGCYCEHCKAQFARYRKSEDTEGKEAEAFPRFRTTIARDFFAEMRDFARSLKPEALITANNSTNSPDVLYSQCKLYGYSPYEMSKTEDFVVIEDMGSQPRTSDDGNVFEYGPTYKQLQALCHDKPLVVCTIADADYHTPPNLMRLAMAEAAANQATYMVWSTWPEEHREHLSKAVRQQFDFLRQYSRTFEKTYLPTECSVFFPTRGFEKSGKCRASEIAKELSKANIQFRVFTEHDLDGTSGRRVWYEIYESEEVKNSYGILPLPSPLSYLKMEPVYADSPNWMEQVYARLREFFELGLSAEEAKRYSAKHVMSPSLRVEGARSIRGYIHHGKNAVYVHLLNLNIKKKSSFEDVITPAENVRLRVLVTQHAHAGEMTKDWKAELFTADEFGSRGTLEYRMDTT